MDLEIIEYQPRPGANNVEVAASNISKQLIRTSKIFDQKYEDALPKIKKSELQLGSFLGNGSFSNVHEISDFSLEQNNVNSKDNQSARNFLKTHVLREKTGDYRYAVKFLRNEIINDPDIYLGAAIDFVVETKLLCSLIHPNIVKLRGLSASGEKGFSIGESLSYFLILDRLYDTLEKRIAIWKSQRSNHEMILSKCGLKINNEKFKKSLSEKFRIAFDIAGAFKYMHSKNVIYRDLKPENLGFDVRGDIKLFDFGLSKEITPQQKSIDGTYHLTGRVGSLRYMAPEVAQCKNYNLAVDVYSYSLLLWEMLTLKKPFKGYSLEMFKTKVLDGSTRPKIPKHLPVNIRDLLKSGWSSNSTERPTFDEICTFLKREITSNELVNEKELTHSRRRSTYIMFSHSALRLARNSKSDLSSSAVQ